jgi:hypothetical protein
MTQNQLNRLIADATGEDIGDIRQRGFSRAICHDNLKIHARVLDTLGIEGHWPAVLFTKTFWSSPREFSPPSLF